MNTLFNNLDKALSKRLLRNLMIFFILFSLLKVAALVLMQFLPAVGVTKTVTPFKVPEMLTVDGVKMFGLKSAAAKKSEAKKNETVSETVYPLTALKLKAIFHSPTLSFVTLEDGKDVAFLDIGQSFKGYTLTKVFAKKAIFTRSGKQYELTLEDDLDKKISKATAGSKKKATTQTAVQTLNNIPRDEIKSYQKDMSKIWSNIGLKEHRNGKAIDGFIVTFVKRGSVFEQLGLQKGDILTEANGIKLNSYKDALNIYKKIDTIKVFKLTVQRNNEEKELEYEIF